MTVGKIAFVLLITFVIQRSKLINMPDSGQMEDFQFNLITVSTVFAGFSLTVLGMLLGMFSEPMVEKLKDTNIITRKSSKLMNSVIAFCGSGIVSLLFIVRVDQFIGGAGKELFKIIEYSFVLGIVLMAIGIIYFISSTIGVFQLISKIYTKKIDDYKEKEKVYKEELEKAKNKIKQKE